MSKWTTFKKWASGLDESRPSFWWLPDEPEWFERFVSKVGDTGATVFVTVFWIFVAAVLIALVALAIILFPSSAKEIGLGFAIIFLIVALSR